VGDGGDMLKVRDGEYQVVMCVDKREVFYKDELCGGRQGGGAKSHANAEEK